MPYDSEIIAFLRRVDKDDDGVISGEEFDEFIQLFHQSDNVLDSMRTKHITHVTSQCKLKNFSPGRPIANNKLAMLSPQGKKRERSKKKEISKSMVNPSTSGSNVVPSVLKKTSVDNGSPIVEVRESFRPCNSVISQGSTSNSRIRYSKAKLISKVITSSQDKPKNVLRASKFTTPNVTHHYNKP